MRSYVAAVFLGLLVAHASAAGATCEDDAAAFEGYLRGLDRGFELAVIPDHTTVVPHDGLAATPHALQVNLTPDGIRVEFDKVALAKLGDLLRSRARMQADPEWQHVTPGWAGHYRDLVLVIDASIPWREVATVARLCAAAGFTHVYFMFARPEQAAAPPHTAVDDAFAKATTETARIEAFAHLRPGFEARCPALAKPFALLPSHRDDWFRATFVPAVGDALRACSCNVDLAQLRSWMFHGFTPVVQTGALGVELAKDARPLALRGTTPWREASKKLVAGKTWLVAR